MPNLNIVNASTATQSQAQAPQDSSASQAAESFGSVLARQQASKEPSGDAQTVPAATDGTGVLQEVKEARLDAAGFLLAELLPPADRSNEAAIIEEDDFKARIPDEAAALPGDVQLALMPGSVIQQGAAVQQSGLAGESGEAKTALPSFVGTKGHGEVASSNGETGAVRSEVFQAALETFGKNSGSPAQPLDSVQASLQPVQNGASVLAGLPQNGAAPLATAANAAAQLQLGTPLASSGWGDELSQKIVWMATQREQIAELHLNPPNLGPLEVMISVSDDQATALFTSQHAAVRNAVEQALPRLREMLADNGITLGNATVSDQPPRERQEAQDSSQRNDGRRLGAAGEAGVASSNQAGLGNWPGRRHEGMVDTFA